MKLTSANFNTKDFKKQEHYQQTVDYAQSYAKKTSLSSNIDVTEFADTYSQSYLQGYEDKKHKIKNFQKIANLFIGTLALIAVTALVIIFPRFKKS
ncbi:MAG: hypothetical protein WCK67_10495 [bacterium]